MRKSTKAELAGGGGAILLAVCFAVGIDAGFDLLAEFGLAGGLLLLLPVFGLLALRVVLGLLAAVAGIFSRR